MYVEGCTNNRQAKDAREEGNAVGWTKGSRDNNCDTVTRLRIISVARSTTREEYTLAAVGKNNARERLWRRQRRQAASSAERV